MQTINNVINANKGYYIMKKYWILLIAIACVHSARSQSANDLMDAEIFTAGGTLPYRIYYPKNLMPERKIPLVLFLHGAGERGNDNAKQLVHGVTQLLQFSINNNEPAYIIAPQCPLNKEWYKQMLSVALAIVSNKIDNLPVDTNRLYVTGLSMGGHGTWDALIRAPHLWAAGIPICGKVKDLDPAVAAAEIDKHTPIWVFHGDNDTTVSVWSSINMVKALREVGADVHYTEYPGVGHDSWTRTYNNKRVLQWFFAQRKM